MKERDKHLISIGVDTSCVLSPVISYIKRDKGEEGEQDIAVPRVLKESGFDLQAIETRDENQI